MRERVGGEGGGGRGVDACQLFYPPSLVNILLDLCVVWDIGFMDRC
jgi:hypothetical protein